MLNASRWYFYQKIVHIMKTQSDFNYCSFTPDRIPFRPGQQCIGITYSSNL